MVNSEKNNGGLSRWQASVTKDGVCRKDTRDKVVMSDILSEAISREQDGIYEEKVGQDLFVYFVPRRGTDSKPYSWNIS